MVTEYTHNGQAINACDSITAPPIGAVHKMGKYKFIVYTPWEGKYSSKGKNGVR